MLWSQYKSATIRRTEFLRKEITGIPNIANRNSNFLTLQTLEFQKKKPTGIFGIEHGIGIPLMMGVPEIGPKNRNSQPRCPFCILCPSSAQTCSYQTASSGVYSQIVLLGVYLQTASPGVYSQIVSSDAFYQTVSLGVYSQIVSLGMCLQTASSGVYSQIVSLDAFLQTASSGMYFSNRVVERVPSNRVIGHVPSHRVIVSSQHSSQVKCSFQVRRAPQDQTQFPSKYG